MSHVIVKLMAWLLPAKPKKLGRNWSPGPGVVSVPGMTAKQLADLTAKCKGDFAAAPIAPPWCADICGNPTCACCARRQMIRSLYVAHRN